MTEIVEGEIVDALPAVREAAPLNLFGVAEPEQVVEKAASVASALAAVVKKQKLTSRINSRDHVRVEGWTLLGSMLGVFPVCVWTRKLEDGWEARVEARTRDGAVVGAAEAECLRSENTWKNRDDYALRSMAQTRATSKAMRQPLGFVMTLAGFDATPAEEMPRDEPKPQQSKLDKLQARLAEMFVAADKALGVEPGWTHGIVALAATKAFGPEWGTSEIALTQVGIDLKAWADTGYEGDFKVVPF